MNKRIAKKWAKYGGKSERRRLRWNRRVVAGLPILSAQFIAEYMEHYHRVENRLAEFCGGTP